MPILNLDVGSYTGPVSYPWQAAEAIINASWDLGVSKLTDASAKVTAAKSDFLDSVSLPSITPGTVGTPSVTEPGVTIPGTIDITDIVATYDDKTAELIATLSSKFTTFIATHFPDEANAYTAAEDVLQAALASPHLGIPATVADQIIGDDRALALSEAARATDEVLAKFASLGYPLPPGAAAAAAVKIQQQAQDKIAESSRKLTIATLEQFRFAVDKTLSLRQIAMQSALDYIKSLVAGPDYASRLVGVGYDAQSKLIDAAGKFLSVRTEVAALISKAEQFNVTAAIDANAKNQTAFLGLVDIKGKALLSEVDMVGRAATSLFNNLNVSSGGTGSSSDGIHYNYSGEI